MPPAVPTVSPIPDIAGRRYVVTGGAGGIGGATAEILRRSGAEVTTVDVLPAPGDGPHLQVDLADRAAVEGLVSTLGSGWNGLFNVAGLPGTHPADDVFRVNVLAPIALAQGLLPAIEPGGTIVHVASITGAGWPQRLPAILELLATEGWDARREWLAENPQADIPHYDFSKEILNVFGLREAHRTWARGVTTNVINPGAVATRILRDFESSMGQELLDYAAQTTGRHATAGDIAPAVAALASPALSWVNGAALAVDGGFLGPWMTGAITPPEPQPA